MEYSSLEAWELTNMDAATSTDAFDRTTSDTSLEAISYFNPPIGSIVSKLTTFGDDADENLDQIDLNDLPVSKGARLQIPIFFCQFPYAKIGPWCLYELCLLFSV